MKTKKTISLSETNKDNLFFSDKVYVIPVKESKSEIFMQKENNLIEQKSQIQSDNFSYRYENTIYHNSHKAYHFNSLTINAEIDSLNTSKNQEYSSIEELNSYDNYIQNFPQEKYKIVSPSNNQNFQTGETIWFECAMKTNNPLIKEDFSKLIWFSDLDGLIGIENNFSTILSEGKHKISLLILSSDNIKIIKDEINIFILPKQISSPEINQ